MSQISGQPDFLYSLGADTRQLEAAMKDTSRQAESAFGKVGTKIEKSTEGARRFVGALGSTIGIATGLVGVFGAVAGAAYGLYSLYENIAGSAERGRDAIREQEQSFQQMLLSGREFRGEETLADRQLKSVEDMREEVEELNKIIERNKRVAPLGFGDPQTIQRSFEAVSRARNQIATLENEILRTEEEIARRARQPVLDLIQSNRKRQELTNLDDAGYELQLSILNDRYETLERIDKLEQAIADADRLGYADLIPQLEAVIRSEEDLLRIRTESKIARDEEYKREQQIAELRMKTAQRSAEFAEQEAAFWEQQNQMRSAEQLRLALQERLYRAEGKDDLADQVELEQERMEFRERLASLPTIPQGERQALERLFESVLRQESLPGEDAAVSSDAGPRFGSGAAGNTGTAVASQVLGGTGNIERRLDEKRNTQLAKIETNTSEMTRALREGGGPARFS